MSAVRFLSAEKNPKKIQESFYSILIFVFAISFVISIIVFLLSDTIALFVLQDETTSYYVKAGAGLIVLGAVTQIVTYYFRIFRQIQLFSGLTIYQSIGQLILTFVLLINGFGLRSVIGANLLISFTLFLFALFLIKQQIGVLIPKFCYLMDFLKFGAPLTPNGLIRWITDSSDRYIIGFLLGATMVGIYNAAYAIGSLIQLLISPLQMILYPELAKLYDEGNYDTVRLYISMSIKYFCMIGIPAVFGLFLISKPLILLFTTSDFLEGASVIPIVALAAFFGGIFQILINVTLLIKITRYNIYMQLSAATTNLFLNLYLIPIYGIIGAAYATLISFLVLSFLGYLVAIKYIQIHIDLKSTFKCILSSGLMIIPLIFIPINSVISLTYTIFIGIITYFISLCILKFFSPKEIGIIKSSVKL